MLNLLPSLLFIAAPASAQPLPTLNEVQFDECIKLAGADPASAVTEAAYGRSKAAVILRARAMAMRLRPILNSTLRYPC